MASTVPLTTPRQSSLDPADQYAYAPDPGIHNQFLGEQIGANSGLTDLMRADTSAQRQGIQEAMTRAQTDPINVAADRQRQALLEGTFAHGVGNSSMQTELQGRLAQEQNDAVARAGLNAYTGAGGEQRSDLASRLGLYTGALGVANQGLQGEANIGLNQNAQANNLDLAYQQLGQQGQQFGQNLAYQDVNAAANRALQSQLLGRQFSNAQDLQSNAQLFQGLGAGIGGLAALFGPSLAQVFPAARPAG